MNKKTPLVQKFANLGQKMTPHRKVILQYLEKNEGLFSTSQVVEKFKNIDRASVYRTFTLLQKLDIIHSIGEFDGEQYFELHEKEGKHHHHILCTHCKKSKCIDCEVKTWTVSGFKNQHHSFLVTGLCIPCTRKMEAH